MNRPVDPVLFAIPFFLFSLIAEGIYLQKKHRDGPNARNPLAVPRYNIRDALLSLGMGLGNVFQSMLFAAFLWKSTVWIFARAPWHLEKTLGTWLLLFLAEDFCYYWFHRWSHRVRIWWAAHVNHHSSQAYNLAAALRQNWTGNLVFTWVMWMPLPLLGFSPDWIFLEKSVSLLYQYWIHTETIYKLPAWLEWLFNTPSHHRVHHGKNVRYLDCNYGGILILWDRLFGTFIPEEAGEPVRYGLVRDLETPNLLQVAFHEWVDIFRDLRQAKNGKEVFSYLLGPPGWSVDGSRKTSEELKALSRAPVFVEDQARPAL